MNNVPIIGTLFFGLVIVVSVLIMLFTSSVVRAAYALIIIMLSVAALFGVMHAGFLAVVQIMVYAGGVVVLFAFGIMLTNRAADGKLLTKHHLVPVGLFTIAIFLWLLLSSVDNVEVNETSFTHISIAELGTKMMTQYIVPFELIAFLLLVVLVGASYFSKSAKNT